MKQPEALLLADEIQLWNNPCARAAAELRRLHEANQDLEDKVLRWRTEAVAWSVEFEAVKKLNKELHEANKAMLSALKNLLQAHYNNNVINANCLEAEAAIAEGEQP